MAQAPSPSLRGVMKSARKHEQALKRSVARCGNDAAGAMSRTYTPFELCCAIGRALRPHQVTAQVLERAGMGGRMLSRLLVQSFNSTTSVSTFDLEVFFGKDYGVIKNELVVI